MVITFLVNLKKAGRDLVCFEYSLLDLVHHQRDQKSCQVYSRGSQILNTTLYLGSVGTTVSCTSLFSEATDVQVIGFFKIGAAVSLACWGNIYKYITQTNLKQGKAFFFFFEIV